MFKFGDKYQIRKGSYAGLPVMVVVVAPDGNSFAADNGEIYTYAEVEPLAANIPTSLQALKEEHIAFMALEPMRKQALTKQQVETVYRRIHANLSQTYLRVGMSTMSKEAVDMLKEQGFSVEYDGPAGAYRISGWATSKD